MVIVSESARSLKGFLARTALKVVRKTCHSFTFALLITPDGVRMPFQIPHDTPQSCLKNTITHRTTAESAAGFAHYRLQDFNAVKAWVEIAITTVLFLEYERAQRLTDRRLSQRLGNGGRLSACTACAPPFGKSARAVSSKTGPIA